MTLAQLDAVEKQALYGLLVYGKVQIDKYDIRVLKEPGRHKVELRRGSDSVRKEPLESVMAVISTLLYSLQIDEKLQANQT